MPSIFDKEPGKRWPRSQRFKLSSRGTDAEQRYREMIVAARADEGRISFDAARTAWAQPLQVNPDDGLYLGELQSGPRTLDEMTRGLEACGSNRRDVKAAIERLSAAGLIEIVSAQPPPAPATPLWR